MWFDPHYDLGLNFNPDSIVKCIRIIIKIEAPN